jgi:lipase chaperone LimK
MAACIATGVAACVALSIGLYVGWDPLGMGPSGSTDAANAAPDASREQVDPRNGLDEARNTALPASLEGTVIDGALVVDEGGSFVANRDAIDFFDYYLAATGEETDTEIHARIVTALEARLDGEAARDARALLDLYLDYRKRAARLLTGPRVGEDTARRLQYIRELRREVFGAELALALFGDQEKRWFLDLERQRVLSDASLDPEARARQLAALEDAESSETIAARNAARAHRLLRDQEAALREAGAGTAEIAQLREEQFGPEGAQRLAELDAAREHWRERLETYRAQRDDQLANVPAEDRAQRIEALRSEHFDASERVRVRALDRAEQARAGAAVDD